VDSYLTLVDEAAPGLIAGLYLIGSVALDDFRPDQSDVDFVAVTAAEPTASELAALAGVHQRLAGQHRRPHFDGAYVTWAQLAADPAGIRGPDAHEGRLRPDAPRDPVTWHMMARHGVAVRGPHPDELDVRNDRAGLHAWIRTNLDGYWRPWHRRASRLLSPAGLAVLGSWGPAWAVLGVSRLHYTLMTGEITSKTGAGRYAADVFDPRFRPIAEECLRLRQGDTGPSAYRTPLARRRAALDFLDMAIEDARRI
jgi:hypothetical protein